MTTRITDTVCPDCQGPAFVDHDEHEIVCENGCQLREGAYGVTADGRVVALGPDEDDGPTHHDVATGNATGAGWNYY